MYCKNYAKMWAMSVFVGTGQTQGRWKLCCFWQLSSLSWVKTCRWTFCVRLGVFVFLFFCDYNLWGKTGNRRVQKTRLAFTAAKQLCISEPIVDNEVKSCCLSFSSGTASLKLQPSGQLDSLQVQPKKVFPFPVRPGRCSFACWQQRAQADRWCPRSPSYLWP